MIVSRPRINTLTALSVFLVLIFASFFYLLHSLLTNEAYFFMKLILAPVVLAIGLVVLSKVLAAIKVVKAGNNLIEVFYPVSRMRITIKVADILGWHEEVVSTKNGEYREVKILYTKKKILKLSNRESTEYQAIVQYLRKKVKAKS